MHQSSYDVVSLDHDVIILLLVATRQPVVSIHYIAQSAPRDKLSIALCISQRYGDMLIIDYNASAPRQHAYFGSSEIAY